MKKLFYPVLMFFLSITGCKQVRSKPEEASNTMTARHSIYDQSFDIRKADGTALDLSIYKGKKLLVVNTASECGYTPQYEELQQLHEQYGNKIQVLAFPANNFGGQEPGSDAQIQQFCSKNYGVTFPVLAKISVTGNDAHPLFQWLADPAQNGWNSNAPDWNFCKYLIDENGELIRFFNSSVSPVGKEILEQLK